LLSAYFAGRAQSVQKQCFSVLQEWLHVKWLHIKTKKSHFKILVKEVDSSKGGDKDFMPNQ